MTALFDTEFSENFLKLRPKDLDVRPCSLTCMLKKEKERGVLLPFDGTFYSFKLVKFLFFLQCPVVCFPHITFRVYDKEISITIS